MPTWLTLWIQSSRSRADRSTTTNADSHHELHSARHALLNCIHDCSDGSVRLLQKKIQQAQTHRDLWALRSEIYQCVAMQHHQAMATERLQSLAHHFEGWVGSADVRPRTK